MKTIKTTETLLQMKSGNPKEQNSNQTITQPKTGERH